MDFSAFDSRSAADEGRPLHLEHPATGEKMMDGDVPCIVTVLGIEGRVAQASAREAAKLPKLDDNATVEEWHERLCLSAEKLITGFASGVSRGDRPAGRDDARWFLDLQMANPLDRGRGKSFVEQVLRFSGDRAAYLGKPEAASAEPLRKSAGKTPAPKSGPKRAARI